MLHGRKYLATALSGLALATIMSTLVAVGLVGASPATADPSMKDVKAQVDDLYRQAEVASERLNTSQLQLKQMLGDLVSLQADQDLQDGEVRSARSDLQDSIISQYEGQDLSAVGSVTSSDDPNAFVSKVSTLAAFNDLQGQLFTDYATAAKALDLRAKATQRSTAQLTALQSQLAADKQTIDDKLAKAKDVLGTMQANQREQLLSRTSASPVPTDIAASGRAAVAVHFALAQVGKAYVYGAAGPSAFDCSGLMMAAWGAAGVSLPHSSSAQTGSGTHVSAADLQPGDLVFYYSPISHVGMYIGNGLIVGAQNPSDGVRVVGLYSMPYSGAVHIG